MTSTTDTAAALDVATLKLTAASDRIAALQEQEAQLSNALGEAVANDDADLASDIRGKRDLIRDALEDLLYGRNTLAQRVDSAAKAHADAQTAEHRAAVKAASGNVLTAGAAFETALGIIVKARDEFVSAGQALSRITGDARFSTETLAADFLARRLHGLQNVEFSNPVPALLQHVEAL